MKLLKKILFSLVPTVSLSMSVVYGSYHISHENKIYSDDLPNETYPEEGKYKITFTSSTPEGGGESVIYVDPDYNLSLKDAPYVSNGSTSYQWTSTSGNINLATFDGGVTSDMTFESSTISNTDASSYGHAENLSSSLSQTDSVPDVVSYTFDSLAYTDDVYTSVSLLYKPMGGSSYSYEEHSSFSPSLLKSLFISSYGCVQSQCGAKLYNNNTFNGTTSSNYNNDCTIALANVEGDDMLDEYRTFNGTQVIGSSANSTSPYASTYTTAVTNYPVARYTLENDIIYSGSTLTLAAHNGYYGNYNWSQINFNNFIVGPYYEIDLNGHDLILTNGSSLISYGSITDSVGGGKVIIEDGSSVLGLITLEDCWHETDVGIYGSNLSILRMYRMPYLNCDIEIKQGGILQGYLMKDSGGQNYGGFGSTVNLIGPSGSDSLIEMSGNGSITRCVYYDENIRYSNVSNKTERSLMIRNNLLHQRIKYTAYDCELSFEQYEIPVSMSGSSATLDSRRSQFFIPPYFEIYLEHSKLTLDQHVVFLPGSYLNIDQNSEIIFSSSTDGYRRAGGLTFAPHLFDNYSSAGLINLKGNDNDSTTAYMYYSSETSNQVYSFWTYLNENKQAQADIYGKFTFEENTTNFPYVLAGNINFYNEEGLDNYFNSGNYNSNQTAIIPAYPHSSGVSDVVKGTGDYAVMDFFTYPIVSEGKVVNINNTRIDEEATYDPNTGLIKRKDGTYYAFIFNEYKEITSYYDGGDSMLPGSFVRVEYTEGNNYITYNGTPYIFFQGAYVPASTADNNAATGVNLERHIGYGGSRSTIINSASNCTMSYNTTIKRWCISTAA